MKILAHRGIWHEPVQRNRPEALSRALAAGMGIETDIRDAAARLVITHDPPRDTPQLLSDFFGHYCETRSLAPLALNIKADGLRSLLGPLLRQFGITNYFCFDMSLPETLAYQREGFRFFTRESEYEPDPALYDAAAGVWMDMFHGDWITPTRIRKHLAAGKQVALVSPELHHREHLAFWTTLREAGLQREADLMLCTDFPLAARDFFHA